MQHPAATRCLAAIICGCSIIAAVHVAFLIVAWSRHLCHPAIIALLSPLFIPIVLYLCCYAGCAVCDFIRTGNRRRFRSFKVFNLF